MALTATASQGFQSHKTIAEGCTILLPGDPGVTFAEGDLVIVTNGVLVLATDSAEAVARVAKSVVCPAATTGFPAPRELDYCNFDGDSKNLALIPVEPLVAAGTKVLKATFKNHYDDTVVSYTANTRAIACTTGMGADDRPNGGILYVYEGTGAGQVNVVEDYDHTGGAAELLLICHRAFDVALDSTSKFIVVGGEAAADRGVTFLGRVDVADEDEIDASDGANDGKLVVFLDFREADDFCKNLMLPVVKASALIA